MCCDKLIRKLNFSSPMLQRNTLFTTEIYTTVDNSKYNSGQLFEIHCKWMERIGFNEIVFTRTNGNAAQYFISVWRNRLRSIWMMVVSIIVTLCIIQISLADRATNDPAIIINSIVSLDHAPGMIIPDFKDEIRGEIFSVGSLDENWAMTYLWLVLDTSAANNMK